MKVNKKEEYDQILKFFISKNCILLTSLSCYVNKGQKLNFICSCGKNGSKSFYIFKTKSYCTQCGKDKLRKYSYDDIVKIFKDNGCKLLINKNDYNNASQDLEYECNCGNVSKTKLRLFKKGTRCIECGIKKSKKTKLLPYKTIYNIIKKGSNLLLTSEENYIDTKSNIKIKCSCGNEYETTYISYRLSTVKKCPKCVTDVKIQKLTYKIDYIKSFLKSHNIELVDYKYSNVKSQTERHIITFKCVCDNTETTYFSYFRSWDHKLCSVCTSKIKADHFKKYHDIKELAILFKDNNCILLSKEYINYGEKLDYICECGKESKISLGHFMDGQRCLECGIKKNAGENNSNWKGGISNLNEYLRRKISKWKLDSLKFYNYKCILSDIKSADLVIHHLYPFNKITKECMDYLNLPIYKEISGYSEHELKLIEDTCKRMHYEYGLGVPILEYYHYEFHSNYSKNNFTPEQFWNYINTKKYLQK